jgi:hypothetical protein
VGWISDNGLVEVTDRDLDPAFRVSNRAKIANVTVTANPHLGPNGNSFPAAESSSHS